MTWLAATAFLVYLTGIGAIASAWPHIIRREPAAQLATDINPAGVCLWLALLTVAWPGFLLYAIAAYTFRRSTK